MFQTEVSLEIFRWALACDVHPKVEVVREDAIAAETLHPHWDFLLAARILEYAVSFRTC